MTDTRDDEERTDDKTEDVRIVESDDIVAPPGKGEPGDEGEVRVVEPDEIEIVESDQERQAREKQEKAPPPKKSNLGMIMIFMVVIFVMLDPNLRTATGNAVGVVMDPLIGFDHELPVLTILLAGLIMITISTVVRHFFMDWTKMARQQNITRAFQAEFRKARMDRDTKRMNELQKAQGDLMQMQQELTGMQMKPMAFTMLVIIPMFAWMFDFVVALDWHWFSTPWNLKVDMFTTEGILFGTSILPHWILLYSVVSIPFSSLLQKALKVWGWRKRVDHVLSDHPDVHDASE
ncbi:MAG: DUF106 domain-containing protein [Euryarchaeota archaeon]|nr:DUF106 domain-containing protein [Euryarchaeota archaeon]